MTRNPISRPVHETPLSHRQFASDEEREEFARQHDFGMPEEKAPYWDAKREGESHKEKMAGMSVAQRNEYLRGLREGLGMAGAPKAGDLDNPLKKDMPKPPPAPRVTGMGSRNPMVKVRHLNKLARRAKGRR